MRRQRGPDSRFIRDAPVVERDVQVGGTSTRLPPTSASRTDRGRCTYAETVAGMSAAIFATTSTSRQL